MQVARVPPSHRVLSGERDWPSTQQYSIPNHVTQDVVGLVVGTDVVIEGEDDGEMLGEADGDPVGARVGELGEVLGDTLGLILGEDEGEMLGANVDNVGLSVGDADGDVEGSCVGRSWAPPPS